MKLEVFGFCLNIFSTLNLSQQTIKVVHTKGEIHPHAQILKMVFALFLPLLDRARIIRVHQKLDLRIF